MRVSVSHTVERMPAWAPSRPAASSMLVSAALRGAGPPNKVSTACCCASLGDRPAVPATGGARLKSGGMISGALRATANSSGVEARLCAQPVTVAAPASSKIVEILRILGFLLGIAPCRLILTSGERVQQQDHDGNADRRIAEVEDQERPPLAEMQVGEIGDIAVAHAVEDVAERAAKHHAERKLVDPVLLAADPKGD